MKPKSNPGSTIDPQTLNKSDRATVVARLRYLGRDDLADLYEHCKTFYPSHSIPSDGSVGCVSVMSTAMAAMSSPSALCMEG